MISHIVFIHNISFQLADNVSNVFVQKMCLCVCVCIFSMVTKKASVCKFAFLSNLSQLSHRDRKKYLMMK